jgi:class 3 adenylate cyclase/tetratricopeptide (TPR) repeat protein
MRFCGNCGARLEAAAGAPLEKVSTEGLGVMMGADLVERMRSSGLDAAGQRRSVSVLFADLTGFTALSGQIDEEELFEIIQQYVRLLANSVYKYEGIVDKFTGDGIMALFGAPISHENNAERAVRAALDMQADLEQYNHELRQQRGIELRMRIGLHSGAVIVGGIDLNLMMNYTAIGDTVNLARRIEEAAPPGSILVSEAVYRQVRVFFDVEQISVLNPKGIAAPVYAYRVVGQKASPGSLRGLEGMRAPMIGRDQELIQLKLAFEDLVNARRGHFILITGEAGLGKSRLTAEFKAWIDQSQARILEGQSLAYRRTVSYWIIRELLLNYLGMTSATPPLQVRERLGRYVYQAMGSEATEVLPYLEHLLSLPYSDLAAGDKLRYLDASQLRQQIFLAVRDLLLVEAYNHPLVLILDDLHWADDASLDLLFFVLDSLRQSPILILSISRRVDGGLLEKAVNWAGKQLADCFHRLALQSLSFDQSKQLLHLLLSIPNLPEKLREQILQRAAGIPFYLEEILRMLIDQGVLQNTGAQWRVVPGVDISELGVPDTLQELILARFDRLQNLQRRVLQVASVVGKDFSLPLLNAVLAPFDPVEMRNVVDGLAEREFIFPQAGTHETEYSFRHILMSDAIYGTLLRRERSELHGRVGEVIERTSADRLDEQVELLANHFRWSPRQDRALHYLILAGQKAARNNVNQQARHHFDAAMEILPRLAYLPEQFYQVHMGLGDCQVFVGEYLEARQCYLEALPALEQNGENFVVERSALYRKIAKTYERQGDYEQALVHLARAQQLISNGGSRYPVERAEILNDIGWIHFRRASFDEAKLQFEAALGLVEPLNIYGVIASIYNRLGGVAYNQGEWDRAASFLRKSIEIRQAIGDVVGLASSSNNLGNLEMELGQLDSALTDVNRNLELVKRLGQVEGIAVAYCNMGWLHIQRGEPEQAELVLNQAYELAQQIGFSSLLREIRKNMGELQLALGNFAAAEDILCEVAPRLEALGASDQLINAYRLLGEAALEARDLPAAMGWLQKMDGVIQAIQQGGKNLPTVQMGDVWRFRGMLFTQMGDWAEAERSLGESEKIFNQLHSRLYLGRTLYQRGALAEAQNRLAEARQYYCEAQRLFKDIGAKLEERRASAACERLSR